MNCKVIDENIELKFKLSNAEDTIQNLTDSLHTALNLPVVTICNPVSEEIFQANQKLKKELADVKKSNSENYEESCRLRKELISCRQALQRESKRAQDEYNLNVHNKKQCEALKRDLANRDLRIAVLESNIKNIENLYNARARYSHYQSQQNIQLLNELRTANGKLQDVRDWVNTKLNEAKGGK